MIDTLIVAGNPPLPNILELPSLLLDLVPERLALELILDHGPLGGGEDVRVEAWLLDNLVFGLLILISLDLDIPTRRWLASRMVDAAGLVSFAEHFLRGGFLRLDGGVDLRILDIMISALLLGSAVVHHPCDQRRSGVSGLVFDMLLQVVNRSLLPDIVDRAEACPLWSSILEVT